MPGGVNVGAFLAFWNSMTFTQRQALTKNIQELTGLSASLVNRGIISGGISAGRIKILKRSKEVTRLRHLVKLTGAKNITFENNRGKIAP